MPFVLAHRGLSGDLPRLSRFIHPTRFSFSLGPTTRSESPGCILHIAEISRRKGELERGYPNLFEYCVRRLNLSEGSVALRIQVANVARRFPQVLASLAEGRISLSVAGRLAPHLAEENAERLLQDCAVEASGGGVSRRAEAEARVRAIDSKAPLDRNKGREKLQWRGGKRDGSSSRGGEPPRAWQKSSSGLSTWR